MEFIIIILLILLNGLFSMSEIALVSARKTRLETEAKKGSKAAQAALLLSGEPDKFLSTIQAGITLIGILTGLYSGEAFAGDLAKIIEPVEILAPYAQALATFSIVFAVTYLTIVFGELIPKRLGLTMSERVAKAMARPMIGLSRVMSPAVWLLSKSTTVFLKIFGIKDDEGGVTEEEIKSLVKEGLNTGEVQEVEHAIVERVFNLGDRDVDSIMTPRNDLVWLNVSDRKDKIRETVMKDMHGIYPVAVEGNQDEIAGVVYLKDLFGRIDTLDFSMEQLIHPIHYLPYNKSVYGALEQFKKARVKYAFVTDEFGEVKGIVTMTDILEALVGEVAGEDEESSITAREDGSFLIDGQCSFYNFLEYFDLEGWYAEHDYNTLSGLILDVLEHVPQEGEKFSWYHFNFEIIDMDGARIDKVLVKTEKSITE
ncbi:MAG: hemolysin family protein [Dysgonamonadaceae bacterium]|jgi:putative hemolysin|nr:hemolysin family protein [Dysgonamonadaceae bacterium]